MITVIIPLYNKELSIKNTIQSVLNQTFQEFEIIVINDGSTDRSVERVESLNDARIRLIHQENQGVSTARNRGIKAAKYNWISFLDGDDWWDKSFLETFYKLKTENSNTKVFIGQYVQVNSKNKIIMLDRFPLENGHFNLYNYLSAFWSSSMLINKKVFEKCGVFDENLTHGEDTDLWIRIALEYKIFYTNKVVAFYNIGGNPLTRSVGKIPSFDQHFISKIDNYIGLGFPEWDAVLIERKANYLKRFYIQDPNNPKIKEMIDSLPDYIISQKQYKILNKSKVGILLKHYKFRIFQKSLKIRNKLCLRINKYY